MTPEFEEVFKRMEPEASRSVDLGMATDNASLVSVAISLKRIADTLSYQPGDESLYDLIRSIALKG